MKETPELPDKIKNENLKNETYKSETTIIAKIESISHLGLVVVEFSESLNTNYSKTDLNASMIDINIVPKNVNLTWTVSEIESRKMSFQINFSEPSEISPSHDYEKLEIHIKEEGLKYFTSTDHKKLNSKSRTLLRKIKSQLPNTSSNRKVEKSA